MKAIIQVGTLNPVNGQECLVGDIFETGTGRLSIEGYVIGSTKISELKVIPAANMWYTAKKYPELGECVVPYHKQDMYHQL